MVQLFRNMLWGLSFFRFWSYVAAWQEFMPRPLDRDSGPRIPRPYVRSHRADKPDSAQIALNVMEKQHRDLRVENSLTDEHGDDVRLKKGAAVEVTVTSKDESVPN
jgi:hypothetical protein